jgi:hypothetical protein
MRIACSVVILIAVGAAGCDRSPAPSPQDDAPSPPPATRPSSAELMARIAALTTMPATTLPATTRTAPVAAAATRAADPLAVPASAVGHLFDLMQKRDVAGLRAMSADPLPDDVMAVEVRRVARRLESGSKWAIVETRIVGSGAVVIFRTILPDGKEEFAPLIFVNRYDRWKIIFGQINVKKFTEGEKADMSKAMEWAVIRLKELSGESTTAPTTAPTAP